MISMISLGIWRYRERYWRREMTEAIEGHSRRSKEGGWSEWVWGSRFPGEGEKVNISPAFLGEVMLIESLFFPELDMRLSIFV